MENVNPQESTSTKRVKVPFQVMMSPAQLAQISTSNADMANQLPPMAGGQDNIDDVCRATFHQDICVEGEVTTTVNTRCETKVFCRGGGIGAGCPSNGFPPPTECQFKFFQNLCVEVDVEIDADAHCDITRVVCGPARQNGCQVTP